MYRILFFVFLFLIQSCKKDETKTLTFKDCEVEYPFYGSGEKILYEGHSITNQWELESARRQLALCLCEKYISRPDIEIKNKILEIYYSNEKYFDVGSKKDLNFETIIKNRNEIFDSKILIN